ncbi:MAG TPA: MATE family efflux transporter [Kofleriaceae bacterium]|jgi:MATE family multidrug resistance protein
MRARLATLMRLALPMVVARATQSAITFADAIQVKHLGTNAIAAVATGGLNTQMFVILPMGIAFIVQSFVAQLTGRGDRDQTRRFAWYGLGVALGAAVLAAAAIPFVAPLLGLLPYDRALREPMTSYMIIRLLSVGGAVGIEALGNWYAGFGNTRMQMIAGIVTMVSAVAFNALLIPHYGVDGAAIASTIASWLGFAVLAVSFRLGLGGAPPHKPDALRLSWGELGRVLRFGLPNGINWLLEFTAFQLFVNVVVGELGGPTVAALNVVIAVNSVAFMPAFGLASAGAIVAGQSIGANARDDVWPTVKLTLACTITWMVAIAAAYLVVPHVVLGWFAPEGIDGATLVKLGTSMLAISALWQVFDATGMTMSETLRAAGDTAWTAGARIVLAWVVFAPASYVVVRYLNGGANGAMVCLVGYLALLALALALRFRSGAWRRIQLVEPKLV